MYGSHFQTEKTSYSTPSSSVPVSVSEYNANKLVAFNIVDNVYDVV